MSLAIDTIEHMFDHGQMSSALAVAPAHEAVTTAETAKTADTVQVADTVQALQERIRSMQATKLDSRLLPTHPAIAELLPGGGSSRAPPTPWSGRRCSS